MSIELKIAFTNKRFDMFLRIKYNKRRLFVSESDDRAGVKCVKGSINLKPLQLFI